MVYLALFQRRRRIRWLVPELGAYNSLTHFKLFWKEGIEQGIVFKMLECSYLGGQLS